MKHSLIVINELEEKGFFKSYAIGGAIAAIFYMNPFQTEGLDIFVLLPSSTNPLMPLTPLYDELRQRGCQEDGPYIRVEGVPVQFLPAYNPLIEEAINKSKVTNYGSVKTRVPLPEYLAAIMIQTGRQKDRARFEDMQAQASLDQALLQDILARHHLLERYKQWTK
jgi:hypothetical protein